MSDTLIWGRSRARSQALRSPVPPPPAPRPQAWPPPSWSPATATSGRARSTQTSGRTGRGGRAVEGRRGASCLPLRQRRGLCVIQQKCVSPLPPPRLPPCLFPAPRAHHNPSPSPVPSSPPLPPGFTTGAAAPWSTSSTMRTRAREWRARTRAMMTCVVVSYDEFCVVVLGVGPPSGSVRHVPTLLWFCCVVCCVCYGPTTLCPACGLLPTPLPPPAPARPAPPPAAPTSCTATTGRARPWPGLTTATPSAPSPSTTSTTAPTSSDRWAAMRPRGCAACLPALPCGRTAVLLDACLPACLPCGAAWLWRSRQRREGPAVATSGGEMPCSPPPLVFVTICQSFLALAQPSTPHLDPRLPAGHGRRRCGHHRVAHVPRGDQWQPGGGAALW